jgi:hypothetical protein
MTKDDDDTLCYRSELEAAVKAEREACAQVCDAFESDSDTDAGAVLAAAIRARGQACT